MMILTLKRTLCCLVFMISMAGFFRIAVTDLVFASENSSRLAGSNAIRKFPRISLSCIDPRTINPQAFSYQMADYDAKRNQVLFYPYGSIGSIAFPATNSGMLLIYDVGNNDFTNPARWKALDLSRIINPDTVNFGGGFLDDQDNFAYLAASGKARNRNQLLSAPDNPAIAVKLDLAKQHANPNDPTAYESFDLRRLPGIPYAGGFSGVFANGYAYFCPTLDMSNGFFHGALVRYNSAEPFSLASSWQWFDLNRITDPPDPELGGMQSMAYIKPYVYLIPFISGRYKHAKQVSKIVRYDTTKDFQSSSSYQMFDLRTLPVPAAIKVELRGFTGGVVVGKKLVLVPWGSRDNQETAHVAAIFDATKQLNDPAAWEYIDLRAVNPKAGGYQFGWHDKNGFVWFVPTHNYDATTRPLVPPFVAWNSALPFNDPSAWTSYPNSFAIWSTGAGYDPTSNTAWFAPYGEPLGGLVVPLIIQLQEIY
jgi:hypothetical protein